VAVDGGRSTAAGGVGDPCSSAEEHGMFIGKIWKKNEKDGNIKEKLRIFRCVDREIVGRLVFFNHRVLGN
jgi:hypothetical protein